MVKHTLKNLAGWTAQDFKSMFDHFAIWKNGLKLLHVKYRKGFLLSFQMAQHIDSEGDCPLAVVNCRYADVACKYKVYSFLSGF